MTTTQAGHSSERQSPSPAGTAPIPLVHIITKLELGGAQQNTLYTVGHVDRRRFAPHLIAGCGGLLDEEARRLEGVEVSWLTSLVREIRPWCDLVALFSLWRVLRRIRRSTGPILLVHTHSSKAGILGRWAARLAGATVIVHTYHGFGFHPGQPAWLRRFLVWLERMTAHITDGVVVVSRANQELGAKLGLFRADDSVSAGRPPGTLIRSGIAFTDFRPDDPVNTRSTIRRSLKIPSDAPVMISVACLKPQKAPLDLIGVARYVQTHLPDAHLLIVGDGELRPQVEAAIEAASLDDHVRLLGWRRDVPALLQAADLFLLTSRWEGLPRAILEAMMSGLPVVSTDVDGVTDVVQHGVTGYVASPGDDHRLAEHAVKLLMDPALRQRMGKAASALSTDFDIDMMVSQQDAFYRRLLAAKGVTIA
jgi:glycosyltransferase involved in cell wall biosynthesis